MEFHYQHALLPDDNKVLKDINEASARLLCKLSHIDVNLLDVSDAGRKYFSDQVRNMRSTVRNFSYILSWSIAYSDVPYDEFVFIDHGGGVGVLSLLAKELGLGTVIYNDLWAPYCKDAQIIAEAIEANQADHYILGDINELVDFLKTNSISCNALASYDVIEHIYDIEAFLVRLSDLSAGPLTLVMASSANPFNPLIRRHHMEFQRKAEYGGREKEEGCREDYLTKAYIVVRQEIISKHAPSLSDTEVRRLAKATRGLIEPDIKEAVDEYLKTANIPQELDHPTNTVNPYTGNWAERLHDVNHLKEILSNEGFKVDILAGYYANSKTNHPLKRFIGIVLNPLIRIMKDKGLFFAPFYTIYASKGGSLK
jgi:hypothetical protein